MPDVDARKSAIARGMRRDYTHREEDRRYDGVKTVCLACSLLQSRELAPTEKCVRDRHALILSAAWRRRDGAGPV